MRIILGWRTARALLTRHVGVHGFACLLACLLERRNERRNEVSAQGMRVRVSVCVCMCCGVWVGFFWFAGPGLTGEGGEDRTGQERTGE